MVAQVSRPSVGGHQLAGSPVTSLQQGLYLATENLGTSDNRTLFHGLQPALDRAILIERVTGLDSATRKLALDHKPWVLALQHIHLALCVDVFVEKGALYTVMAAGTGQMLDRVGHLTQQQAVSYGVQICNALNYLQLCPDCATHCTIIDPTTVYVTEAHRARLTPMAALLGVTDAHSSSRFAPRAEAGSCADVFCVGATLHHTLTGWDGTYADGAPALTSLRPDLAPDLNAVIMQALAPNPAERYQGIPALRYALLRLG